MHIILIFLIWTALLLENILTLCFSVCDNGYFVCVVQPWPVRHSQDSAVQGSQVPPWCQWENSTRALCQGKLYTRHYYEMKSNTVPCLKSYDSTNRISEQIGHNSLYVRSCIGFENVAIFDCSTRVDMARPVSSFSTSCLSSLTSSSAWSKTTTSLTTWWVSQMHFKSVLIEVWYLLLVKQIM